MGDLIPFLVAAGVLAVVVLGLFTMMARFYRKVDQGTALVVSRLSRKPSVSFSGGLVWPIIDRAEEMDISVKTIVIDRRESEGLICQDNIRADIKVTFFVRVNREENDVLEVAQSLGVARASDDTEVEKLFAAKFSEALKTVGKRMDFESLYQERDSFRKQVFEVIGKDLNGFVLDDAAIDYLEQTALEHLMPTDVLDAQGIHKITRLTTQQNIETNKYKQEERKAITQQNVEADQTVFELEKQRAEAKARQEREIATLQSREAAETAKIQSEETQRAGIARVSSEEALAVAEQNKLRQIAVADWNKQRVIAVETERVKKDQQLEAITREREVELQRIAKEKDLEVEKKKIADLISGRIAVEKKVAEEEEGILTLRAIAGADRGKDVLLIGAEAAAQEKLVKDIKAAEAGVEVAKHAATTTIIQADASLEAADKEARARIRTADGTKAAQAAEGLAAATVKEAMASALEKEGMMRAKITFEQLQAEAAGAEKKGLADVNVKSATAAAIEKVGLAEANSRKLALLAEAAGEKEKLLAVAAGERERGMAGAQVKEADASATEKLGLAEAVAKREGLLAEAAGLAEKAISMKALEGAAQQHEEFRMRLEKQTEVELERVRIMRHVAEAQAATLGAAFGNAKINIVGGDGQFFDRFVKAVGMAQSVDGFVDNSERTQTVLHEYLKGDSSLPQDLKEILSRPRLTPEALQSLTLSAALTRLAGARGIDKDKLDMLLDKARELGIDATSTANE